TSFRVSFDMKSLRQAIPSPASLPSYCFGTGPTGGQKFGRWLASVLKRCIEFVRMPARWDTCAMTPTQARVATRMLGGLGNQLFQYAAGRALATRLGTQLILDCSATVGAERPFVLDRYPIDAA